MSIVYSGCGRCNFVPSIFIFAMVLFSDVIVGFRLALYEVMEGQAVAVCVDLVEGLIDPVITIRLTHRLTPSSGKVPYLTQLRVAQVRN